MEISLDALFSTIAEAKNTDGFPCMLSSLKDLVRTVCGSAPGPSVPGFLTDDSIVAGLIVLQQHPVLDNVQFPPGELDNDQYASWMRREKARLKLRDTYDIQTPATIVLEEAYLQARAILRRRA